MRADLIKGIAIGVGVCTVGYVLYKQNEETVNNFLGEHGIEVPASSNADYFNMSIEELMEAQETIEDAIAEKEYSGSTVMSTDDIDEEN